MLADYERLAKAFAERFGLSLNDPNDLTRAEEILFNWKKERGVDWELIIRAGAYVGEVTRHGLGGTWGWDDPTSSPGVFGVGGKNNLTARPGGMTRWLAVSRSPTPSRAS